ncbi:tRNA epoxyqueuosine(34) reductase QueG [soil metagenome]
MPLDSRLTDHTRPQWVLHDAVDREHELSIGQVRAIALDARLALAHATTAEPFVSLREMLLDRIDSGRLRGLDWFDADRAVVASNPRILHERARSIVALGIPFYSRMPEKPTDTPRGRIARYAWGGDYHRVFRKRMEEMVARIEEVVGRPVESRLLSDTARIVDRAVAARSGLGWYGKHTCVIVPGYGSWVMLGEILLDVDIETTPSIDKNCGRCSICIDRCPTGAIVGPYVVDTPRCLSFQTIEQRGPIPAHLRSHLGDWVFGCDVCQDVCPYTGAAAEVIDADFAPRDIENAFPALEWLLSMTEEEFRSMYQGTAVLRTKRRGLARNAAVVLGNDRSDVAAAALAKALAEHDEPLVRGHAAWGLAEIGGGSCRRALDRCLSAEVDEYVVSEIQDALHRL